MVDLLILNKF